MSKSKYYRELYIGYGDFRCSYDKKTLLDGDYWVVGLTEDDQGYEWRGFCLDCFKKIQHLSNKKIYESFEPSQQISEEEYERRFQEYRESLHPKVEPTITTTYSEQIAKRKAEYVGKKVIFEGQEYTVVDVDYNGGLLISKKAEFTDTTAVPVYMVQ